MVSAHVTPCILVYSYRLEPPSVHNKGGGGPSINGQAVAKGQYVVTSCQH
jgi:hypothetical protein